MGPSNPEMGWAAAQSVVNIGPFCARTIRTRLVFPMDRFRALQGL